MEEILKALESLKMIMVLKSGYDNDSKQFNFLIRVNDAKSWIVVVDAILSEEQRIKLNAKQSKTKVLWSSHICKRYVKRNNSLKYGWNLSIKVNDNDNVESAVYDVARLITLVGRHIASYTTKDNDIINTNTNTKQSNTKRQIKNNDNNNKPRSQFQGLAGRVVDGEVVDMPLVGVTENRNKPAAPIGSRGASSKGAHLISPGK